MTVRELFSVYEFIPVDKIIDRDGNIYFEKNKPNPWHHCTKGTKYAHYEDMEICRIFKSNSERITILLDTIEYDGEYEKQKDIFINFNRRPSPYPAHTPHVCSR